MGMGEALKREEGEDLQEFMVVVGRDILSAHDWPVLLRTHVLGLSFHASLTTLQHILVYGIVYCGEPPDAMRPMSFRGSKVERQSVRPALYPVVSDCQKLK